ncbi:MAG: YidC/Oxa1 family membrane protein insertase [Chloroflexi bacterium]|nr:YidC/Oxa1 family membrane protein insertase [Chloroflexota bacterium]
MWDSFISLMINILLYIYSFVGQDFGLAIILFTILVRLVTYPLNTQQVKQSKAMQELQENKKWQEAQKKYKNDKEKLAQEQMKLYKELGVNPFGSCLPTLIQFPIIIGLYQAIIRALAVSPLQLLNLSKHINDGADLIPLNKNFLWMDLSLPEKDFGLAIAGFGIPILAIIVVVTSYMQTKLMTPPGSVGASDQSAQMSKMMNLYMPIFMGWLAYSFSSGLALYFVVSNLATILQYALMGRLDWGNLLPKWAKK